MPEAIYGSIERRIREKIIQEITALEIEYEKKHKQNEQEKKQNLLDLRPNLSNPSCKEELNNLDKKVIDRFNAFVGTIDATQFKLLSLLQAHAKDYMHTILNTTSAGLSIYSSLLFNEDYVLLPGDDISEKKHLNVKNLMVQKEKEGGYVERTNRSTKEKWKGLLKAAFDIDFAARKEYKKDHLAPEEKKAEGGEGSLFTSEIETIKTVYHKAMIKQRDESFKRFKTFFDAKLNKYFEVYDSHRLAEHKFKESWEKNVSALKAKQDIKS